MPALRGIHLWPAEVSRVWHDTATPNKLFSNSENQYGMDLYSVGGNKKTGL